MWLLRTVNGVNLPARVNPNRVVYTSSPVEDEFLQCRVLLYVCVRLYVVSVFLVRDKGNFMSIIVLRIFVSYDAYRYTIYIKGGPNFW